MTVKKWQSFVSETIEKYQLPVQWNDLFCLNVFQKPHESSYLQLISAQSTKLLPLGSDLNHYLPIEFFKTEDKNIFCGQQIFKTFLSSGTTSSELSQSHFSEKGLALYKLASLATFFSVLREMYGEDFWQIHGFSLIPDTTTWPNSSLAQMISWISEYLPLRYCSKGEIGKNFFKNEPIWIFGTAFHFVNLIDNESAFSLPQNSILIETGGTKGRSREVRREDFYQELQSFFNIESRQIVSEYGMCELASQAYDFTRSDQPLDQRYYKFPHWIEAKVGIGKHQFHFHGTGGLSIYDPFRIDFPWAIRTQDLATIRLDQTFQLIGRMQGVSLKGCSLLAEEIVAHESPTHFSATLHRPNKELISKKLITEKLRKFFQSSELLMAFMQEFKHIQLAKNLVESLQKSLKTLDVETIPLSSVNNAIIILPHNHSIVGFYPLVYGVLLGIDITVRLPKNFAKPDAPLMLLINFLNMECSSTIKIVDESYRISESNKDDFDKILIYGTDESIQIVKKIVPHSLQAFGSKVTASLLSELPQQEQVKQIITAFSSLAQRGCRSLRMLVTDNFSQNELNDLQLQLTQSFKENIGSVDISARLLIDVAEFKLKSQNALLPINHEVDALFPVYTELDCFDLSRFVCSAAFVLPIVNVADLTILKTKGFTFVPIDQLEQLHSYAWDGTYDNEKLFI